MKVGFVGVVVFFFFKQKTAYEISTRDWSSDVCSSDLGRPAAPPRRRGGDGDLRARRPRAHRADARRLAAGARAARLASATLEPGLDRSSGPRPEWMTTANTAPTPMPCSPRSGPRRLARFARG